MKIIVPNHETLIKVDQMQFLDRSRIEGTTLETNCKHIFSSAPAQKINETAYSRLEMSKVTTRHYFQFKYFSCNEGTQNKETFAI